MEPVGDGIFEVSLGYVARRGGDGDEMGSGGSKIHLQSCVGGEKKGAGNFSQKPCVSVPGKSATSFLTWRRTVEQSRACRGMTMKTKSL